MGHERDVTACNYPLRRDDGPDIVLHQVAPELEKVLRILGWDWTPGLALDRSLGA
jgi:hypothetical protein